MADGLNYSSIVEASERNPLTSAICDWGLVLINVLPYQQAIRPIPKGISMSVRENCWCAW